MLNHFKSVSQVQQLAVVLVIIDPFGCRKTIFLLVRLSSVVTHLQMGRYHFPFVGNYIISGWWLTDPCEKYESQLGLLTPKKET